MRFDTTDADAWYARNAHVLNAAHGTDDPVTQMIERENLLAVPGLSVGEVGASNGWRLAGLAQSFPGHRYTAMDLSPEAVAAGQRTWPHIRYKCASADDTREPSETYDVLIVSYVLHWIARERLDATAREVDRILRPGGMLVLNDFWPATDTDTPFKHRAGLWTYKRDYRKCFPAFTTWAEAPYAAPQTGERCAVFVLRKP